MGHTALIVVDMISDYEHPDTEGLVSVRRAIPAVRQLLGHARTDGVEVVYVNDNLGRWRSDLEEIVNLALRGRHAGLVEPIRPDQASLFVVKARHSIFYQTPSEYLLRGQHIDRIVLCGQVTEQCILYSALDAHIRHIRVVVARDAVAHIDADLASAALTMMQRNMEANVQDAQDIRLR